MKILLKDILEQKNISIYALAKMTDINANNLSKLIKGQTTAIKFKNLEAICKCLDVTPNDIFGYKISD